MWLGANEVCPQICDMIRDCVTSIHGASAAPNATRCAKVGETADYADVTDKKLNKWMCGWGVPQFGKHIELSFHAQPSSFETQTWPR